MVEVITIRGIILAGGTGTRLRPLTTLINKHLLPIYNQTMIYYPLMTLIDSGIKDMMIVSGREHAGQFLQMLGSGKEFGVNLSYTVQEEAGGIAQALGLCRDFAGDEDIAVILGDNIFEDTFDFSDFDGDGAKSRIYLKQVSDPWRFGNVKFYGHSLTKGPRPIIEIVEKPNKGSEWSNLAVTGLYLYDDSVFNVIKDLKPSQRGELEISDVNNWYIRQGLMDYRIVKGFWSDAGTFSSLFNASEFMKNKVER